MLGVKMLIPTADNINPMHRRSNVLPILAMGVQNLPLVQFLASQIVASKETQLATLRRFVPDAKPEDWTMVWAGQRLQIVKPDPKVIGKLQFGTVGLPLLVIASAVVYRLGVTLSL